ncbi:MAG TPA: VOC family protein [Tahibacter sp.]|uniref:VOC family protein n=1 Tax=Tahibacter sp. TaxID=2056211 RepID=UPI002C104307|nr:VOC family protein [Tahibacter sp.]HSX58866.1 VOC family protein [Tahibacter sp.]
MSARLALVALLVRDYDEAIAFFTQALRFELVEDSDRGGGKRWVVVAPPGGGAGLLLARAATDEQRLQIGDQSGGRVFLFLETDEFDAQYAHMRAHGVRFAEEPRHEDYGSVVVFLDLCGNKWDLLQRR